MSRSKKFSLDKQFLMATGSLVFVGLLIFISAALSRLTDSPSVFYRMLITQIGLALVGGAVAFLGASRIPYKKWQEWALPVLILGMVVTLFVFIPGLGLRHGGAQRWISLGFISFQPAELLKFAVIIYWAAWLAWVGKKITEFRYGLLPFLILSGATGLILLMQPDTGTFLVILATMTAMYLLAGAPLKDFAILLLLGAVAFGGLIAARPYLLDRIQTFRDPSHDPLGSSYQIQQSLIAIGSGHFAGRGFGQSVQKFSYLPEPAGDSIFAVLAEEFGLLGSLALLLLYMWFFFRGMYISSRAPDQFSRLLVAGIILVIVSQSFLNIASIVGLFPLTGLPLVFVSHGGTALFITLFSVGIVMQVSRKMKT